MSIDYKVLPPSRADELESLPPIRKWSSIVTDLLKGKSVFVPDMTKVQLETLRSIISGRQFGTLHSKTVVDDDVSGKLLRLTRKGGAS